MKGEGKKYSTLLSDLVAEMHANLLKSLGFKKQGGTFNRKTIDGLIQVINFQAGAYEPWADANPLYGHFTINFGLFIPEVNEIQGYGCGKFIQEYHCALRARAGELMDAGDIWLDLNKNNTELKKECLDLLKNRGLPFLEKFETRKKIINSIPEEKRNSFTPTPRIVLAVIYHAQNNKDKARALLNEQYVDSADHKKHREYIVELAERLDIKLSSNSSN